MSYLQKQRKTEAKLMWHMSYSHTKIVCIRKRLIPKVSQNEFQRRTKCLHLNNFYFCVSGLNSGHPFQNIRIFTKQMIKLEVSPINDHYCHIIKASLQT